MLQKWQNRGRSVSGEYLEGFSGPVISCFLFKYSQIFRHSDTRTRVLWEVAHMMGVWSKGHLEGHSRQSTFPKQTFPFTPRVWSLSFFLQHQGFFLGLHVVTPSAVITSQRPTCTHYSPLGFLPLPTTQQGLHLHTESLGGHSESTPSSTS